MAPVDDRRASVLDVDAVAASSLHRRQDDWLRAIRFWCRQRAQRKSEWARRVMPLRYKHVPWDQIRYDLGLGRVEWQRIRRWTDDAIDESNDSLGDVDFAEALIAHEARQVDLVTRFAILKRQGVTREEIRAKLGLSHDGYDLTLEWWKWAVERARRDRESRERT